MDYKAILLFFFCGLVLANPEPKPAPEAAPEPAPDADPEPAPEAAPEPVPDPDADGLPQIYGSGPISAAPIPPTYGTRPIYGGSYGGSGLYGGSSVYGGSVPVGASCGMVDECCGASSEGCCMGGQQCYTIYERKCKYEAKPYCNTMTKQMCAQHPIKSCRIARKNQYFSIPGIKCDTKREKKCWTFNKQICERKTRVERHNVTWTDEDLLENGMRTLEKCHTVTTCNIVDDTREVTQQVPEMKCEKVPRNRQVCKSVPVTQPPQEMTKTVMDVTYRKSCVNVPRTKCTLTGCTQNGCTSPGQDVCSTTEVRTTDVCGLCGSNQCQDNACQQVETPVCNQGGGGSCYAGPQQCCRTEYESVCYQIPVKVPRTVTVTVQPPPVFKQQCDTIQEFDEQCRTIMVPKTYSVPYKRCEKGSENKCFSYQVQDQQVVQKPQNEEVQFQTEECEMKEVPETYCATVDVGVVCSNTSMQKGVTINMKICDKETSKQHCYQVPYSNCENSGGQSCEMVPKKVCQDTCNNSSKCNTCSQFVGGGGYSSCNMGKCNNFIPSDSIAGNSDIGSYSNV